MNDRHQDERDPRWLELASALRAEPAPGTLARVRSRLEAREPRWLSWLARPVTLALSAGLLVASAWLGIALVDSGPVATSEDTTFAAALLEDDGNFGLPVEETTAPGEALTDSEQVTP